MQRTRESMTHCGHVGGCGKLGVLEGEVEEVAEAEAGRRWGRVGWRRWRWGRRAGGKAKEKGDEVGDGGGGEGVGRGAETVAVGAKAEGKGAAEKGEEVVMVKVEVKAVVGWGRRRWCGKCEEAGWEDVRGLGSGGGLAVGVLSSFFGFKKGFAHLVRHKGSRSGKTYLAWRKETSLSYKEARLAAFAA
ncbi:hypothetical protein CYMTET_36154 [Cymbomonas tetramitiformis]|uniref:Uncharacterized protein n=1 Tax=Cymbomonas tetramitiformis TaxID=36881 RepID=A0AAE0CGL0_9CHLO|nr:hypothetical protein CYMTET_36154 [Cymbomonas tetramitiformis]